LLINEFLIPPKIQQNIVFFILKGGKKEGVSASIFSRLKKAYNHRFTSRKELSFRNRLVETGLNLIGFGQ